MGINWEAMVVVSEALDYRIGDDVEYARSSCRMTGSYV